MILTDTYQMAQLYDKIKAESRKSSEKHVNIYASAADADSVCALRILENLMQNDLVPHGWTAVSRYQEIIDDFQATYSDEDEVTRFVILINCGAAEDMSALLELADRPHVCLVIIDSCRPIDTIFNDENPDSNVYVLLDERAEGISKADIPFPESDSEADEDDDGSDRENEEGNAGRRQRRRLDSPSSSAMHGRNSARDGGQQQVSGTPSSPGAVRAQLRRERQQRRTDRQNYYTRGVHYGKPSACVLYDLACEMHQDSSYLLWLALLGLTDHFIHNRLTDEKYSQYYDTYHDVIMARGHLDAVGSYEALDGEGTTTNAANVACRIVPQEDYKFGLLREWTLWDAMVNSAYVASRLQTYTEKGRQRLEVLLAKLGIPLQQARSSFIFDMKPHYQQRLQDKLGHHGAAYNLSDAVFRSFQLQDGFNRCVMAVDTVHAATALLESGAVRRKEGEEDTGDGLEDHRDRFWRCWKALSWRDDGGELRRGLELAKKVQTALIRDGGAVVVQRLYHNFKAFRMFDLSDHKLGNHSLLVHPMSLQRLTAFFQEQQVHQTVNAQRKPVVLIGPRDQRTGRCFVVGYQIAAMGKGNGLGDAFEVAAEAVNAQAWHDLFDTTIMEVMQEDVERFKSELLRVASELL